MKYTSPKRLAQTPCFHSNWRTCVLLQKQVIYIRWVRIIYIAKIKNEKLFDIHILFMIKCFVFQNQYCNSICICINIKEQVNFGHCLCLEIEVHTWFIFNNYTGKTFRFRCCSQITPKQTLHLMEYPFGREMSKHCPFNIKPVSWHLICGRQWQSHLHSSTLY